VVGAAAGCGGRHNANVVVHVVAGMVVEAIAGGAATVCAE